VSNIDLIAPLEECAPNIIEIDLLRPRWMQEAACRGEGFDAWFPTEDVGQAADTARRVCSGCPVRLQCLDYALAAGIRHGLWGGLSVKERAALAGARRGPGRTR
jgi:WhiB family redox-sensing transcriptional regulator